MIRLFPSYTILSYIYSTCVFLFLPLYSILVLFVIGEKYINQHRRISHDLFIGRHVGDTRYLTIRKHGGCRLDRALDWKVQGPYKSSLFIQTGSRVNRSNVYQEKSYYRILYRRPGSL